MKQLLLKKIPFTRQIIFSPENLFLFIGYIFGMLLVYSNPPFHSNDEDRHFYNAYFLSKGQVRPLQRENQIGGYLPVSIYNVAASYQGIPFDEGYKINRAKLKEVSRVPLNEAETMFYDNPSYQVNPFPYLPFVAGIWIAKIVNSNPIHLLWGARIAGLVVFLFIVFFAIKIIPIHKYMLLALALNPMTIFQAASVTYDVLTISLSFLIIALALRYACQEKQLRFHGIAFFLIVAIIFCYAKPGYFLVPFIFFVVPQNKIRSIKMSLAMFICLIFICFLPSLTWGTYLTSLHLKGGTLLIKDFFCDSNVQIRYIASAPAVFVTNLFLNFVAQGKEWIIGTMGRLGYSYTHLNHTVLFIHGLVLIAFSVLDSSKEIILSLRQKLVVGCIGFGTIVCITVGFFVISPVGAHTIFGLQGRYFIPILPLLFLLNFNNVFWNSFWEKWKTVFIASYTSLILGYTIYFINSYFY